MAAPEPGGRLPQADVADVDAAADPLGGLEPLGHLDEPAAIQSGGVLEEDEGTVRALAKVGIQLAHRGQQAVGLCPHLTFVMDDQAGDAACEAVGEFPHHGAVSPVQHVEAAAQVDDGQARMGGHELQDVVELVRRVGVHLGRGAHLGEAEPGQLEQRIVPVDALLEQGVNGPGDRLVRGASPAARLAGTPPVTIHDLGRPRQPFHHPGKAIGSPRVSSAAAASAARGRCHDACGRSGRCRPSSSSRAAARAAGSRSGRPRRCCTADR